MDPNGAAEFLSTWGYPAFVLLLLVTAFGSPLPEDLLLLAAGYLIAVEVFQWPLALPLALVGVVGSDSILYVAGRHLRSQARLTGPVRHLVRPGRLRLAARWFGRFGDAVIFGARLVPGTRYVVFVTAGLRSVAPHRFVLLDALAACIWIPFLFFVGGTVGAQIGDFHRTLELVARSAGWILLALVLLALIRWWISRAPASLEE